MRQVQLKVAQIDKRAQADAISRFKAAKADSDGVYAKILKSLVDLGNAVLSKRAAAELHAYGIQLRDTVLQMLTD